MVFLGRAFPERCGGAAKEKELAVFPFSLDFHPPAADRASCQITKQVGHLGNIAAICHAAVLATSDSSIRGLPFFLRERSRVSFDEDPRADALVVAHVANFLLAQHLPPLNDAPYGVHVPDRFDAVRRLTPANRWYAFRVQLRGKPVETDIQEAMCDSTDDLNLLAIDFWLANSIEQEPSIDAHEPRGNDVVCWISMPDLPRLRDPFGFVQRFGMSADHDTDGHEDLGASARVEGLGGVPLPVY